MKLKTSSLTILLLLVFFSISSTSCLVRQLGGKFSHGPEEMATGLSQGTKDLVRNAFQGLKPESIRDYHVHLLGVGSGNTGALVNPEMQSRLHPVKHMKFKVYMSASGIKDPKKLDEEYVARLVKLIRGITKHGKKGRQNNTVLLYTLNTLLVYQILRILLNEALFACLFYLCADIYNSLRKSFRLLFPDFKNDRKLMSLFLSVWLMLSNSKVLRSPSGVASPQRALRILANPLIAISQMPLRNT